MGDPLLRITNGTIAVDLLSPRIGFTPSAWKPRTAQAKGGGQWADNPMAEGRALVMRVLGNVGEAFTFTVNDDDQDALIRTVQDLQRLLEQAVAYSASEWAATPVWIEARGRSETNTRYALIVNYEAPGADNPFAAPFQPSMGHPAVEEFQLAIERGQWLEAAPGTGTATQVSAQQAGIKSVVAITAVPTASTDDAQLDRTTNVFNTAATSATFGQAAAEIYDAAIRFRAVAVPAGVTIRRARIRHHAFSTQSGATCKVSIYGEQNVAPAAFSTNVDYLARTRTAAVVNDNAVGAEVVGNYYYTLDVSTIVAEIIALPGWASGNNMAFFIQDNGSSNGAFRQLTTQDGGTVARLYIEYETTTALAGRAATTAREVYVANKHGRAQITDAEWYDASHLIYSGNLLGGALPYALLPATPEVGDVFYAGIDSSITNSGPFSSLVCDIGTAQNGNLQLVWEYWNGAAWAALTVHDGTAAAQVFDTTGVNSVTFEPPSDWATKAVDGITGWWIRARVTAIGAGSVPPTQQNRHLYTAVVPFIDVDDAQIPGDIPALARVDTYPADHSGIGRLFLALRSKTRGGVDCSDFTPYLNWSGLQNHSGVTLFPGFAATNAQNSAPTGYTLRAAISGDVMLRLTAALSAEYRGQFRALVRYHQNGGAAGDWTMALGTRYATMGTTSYSSEAKPTENTNDWQVMDFGVLAVPPSEVARGRLFAVEFNLALTLAAGASTLDLYDLVLLPCDEWCAAFWIRDTGSVLPGVVSHASCLSVDSIIDGRVPWISEAVTSGTTASGHYTPDAPGPALWQANADQRLWFLWQERNSVSDSTDLRSRAYRAASTQAWRAARYLLMRGNR